MHGIMEFCVYEFQVLKIVHSFFFKYNVMEAYKVITCFDNQLCKLCILLEFAYALVKWGQMCVAGSFV